MNQSNVDIFNFNRKLMLRKEMLSVQNLQIQNAIIFTFICMKYKWYKWSNKFLSGTFIFTNHQTTLNAVTYLCMTVFVVNMLLTIRQTRNATRRNTHTHESDERSRARSPIPMQNHHLQHSVDDSRHVKFILFTQWFCVKMWFDWKYNVSKLFFIKCRNADNKERRMEGFGPYLSTRTML